MLNDVFKRRRCVSPFPDFKKSETIGLIKVRPNLGFSEKNYDFSEKKIIPFNTHEGSGDGETWEFIKELEPKANVLEGLAVHGGEVEDFPKETLENWLSELNL